MSADRAVLLRAMPAVFVLIWSTGFVVARYGMPHAPPMGFLAVRYALSIAAFLLWVAWAGAAPGRQSGCTGIDRSSGPRLGDNGIAQRSG